MIFDEGHIPKEVMDFFSHGGGGSLILRGAPGTGKTTFALELLYAFREHANVCFVSSRIDEHALKKHINWIDFDILLSRGADEGSGLLRMGGVSRRELDRLESRVEAGDEMLEQDFDTESSSGDVHGDTWTFNITSIMPEIDKLYEMLEVSEKDKSLVAVDSINSLGEKYGISSRRLLNMLQKDLVERSGINVVFILETGGSSSMEYIGDGVMSLEMEEMDGRRLRSLVVEKLRGQQILMPRVPFSLNQGHFNAFDNSLQSLFSDGRKIRLDRIISSVLEPGKYTLFELDRKVPAELVENLVRSLTVAIMENAGCIYSTPSTRLFGSPGGFIREVLGGDSDMLKLISPVQMMQRGVETPCTVKVEGENFYTDFDPEFINSQFHECPAPVFLMDANQVLSHYGMDSLKDLEVHISGLLQGGGTCIGFSWTSDRRSPADQGMTNRLVRVSCIGSQPIMYGEKPYSPIYVMAPEGRDALNLDIII